MTLSVHADALESLRVWEPADTRQRELRDVFLELLAHRPDALDRDCAPAHITASAFVVDPARRVLLVFHRKVGRWVQPGGHAESADPSLAAAALREAVEESGIADLRVVPGVLHVDRHPAPCNPGVVEEHFDVRYLVVAPPGATPSVSAESIDVRWFERAGLPEGIETTILEMVALADRRRDQPL